MYGYNVCFLHMDLHILCYHVYAYIEVYVCPLVRIHWSIRIASVLLTLNFSMASCTYVGTLKYIEVRWKGHFNCIKRSYVRTVKMNDLHFRFSFNETAREDFWTKIALKFIFWIDLITLRIVAESLAAAAADAHLKSKTFNGQTHHHRHR